MKSRVATSPSAMRSAATSRARYSASATLRSFCARSCSYCTRSRSAWRFCASRISGAAYDACSDSASVRKMNGYVVRAHAGGATMFQMTQTMMNSGHVDDEPPRPDEPRDPLGEPAERLRVVRRRVERRRRVPRLVQARALGAPLLTRHGRLRARRRSATCRRSPPVPGQQVVQHVVDRDGAQQVVVVVDDGSRDEVVGREVRRDLRQRRLGAQRLEVRVARLRTTRADGGSRSSRWKCATPRNLPVGVSSGGRHTNT